MDETTKVKWLYRSDTDKVFAGICGGLGEYWTIDPTMLRLLWIVATVFTGFVPGIIGYILAVLVIPVRPVVSASGETTVNV